jgi:hypothetical protein
VWSALSGFQVAAVCECLRLPCRRIRLALVVSRVADLVFAKTFLTERPFQDRDNLMDAELSSSVLRPSPVTVARKPRVFQ